MTDQTESERAKMARRRRYLAVALLVAVAWYGVHRYLDHREEQRQIRIAECGAAQSRAIRAWDRFRAQLVLHQFEQYVATKNEERDSAGAQNNLDELDATVPPKRPTIEDLKVLRALAAKWPKVESPDFAELEARLRLCEPE
jgi:hypothetical protein